MQQASTLMSTVNCTAYYICGYDSTYHPVNTVSQVSTGFDARQVTSIILSMLFLKYQLALMHVKLQVSCSCSNKQQPN